MFIIPKPQELKIFDERIRIKSLKIVTDNQEINDFTDAYCDASSCIVTSFSFDKDLKKEKYKITVNKDGISVKYGTVEGAYRAFSTLKQIISTSENNEVPYLELTDYPAIDNRGYMLDISRGKTPTLEYLKKLVDILSDLKYNQLQLYMDTFVYEYKNFPEYWKDTEPITNQEIRKLDAYCKARFIKLVPNQNSFGHMIAWTEKPELSHLAITKDGKPSQTLNPLLDETMEFIDKVYDGYFDAFSADMVNIGMDEPFELGLSETKEACEKYGVGKVYTDYLNKVCKLITEKYNKIPMFWDDIVFKHDDQLDNIPKNAIVMEWGYETEQHFDRNCRRLQERNLRFYVCPGTSMWGSFTGRTNNAIVNIITSAETGNYYGAEGFLLTEWGDGGHPQFAYTSYFPLVFGGAASWNCLSHDTEIGYNQRADLIFDCKQYLDKYIYKTTSEVSLADIVCRLGNFYLLEDCLQFNGTQLMNCLRMPEKITDQKIRAFARIIPYIEGLLSELDTVEANDIALRQIRLNAQMILFALKYLTCKKEECKLNINELISEFEYLWKLDNRVTGMNIFVDFIKSLF